MNLQKNFGVQSWTVSEAIYWVAYRCELEVGPAIIFPDSLGGRLTDLEVISALQARVSGNPREWRPQSQCSDTPAYRYRAVVKRWMRETGLNAPDLLTVVQAEFTRYRSERAAQAKQQEELDAALNELNGAVQEGKLVARGRPCGRNGEPESPPHRVEIPPSYIDPPRRISAGGRYGITEDDADWRWLHDEEQHFYDIEVRADDVRKLWAGSKSIVVDNQSTSTWRSAEAALEPWFESDSEFENLPSELQALLRRGQLPVGDVVIYLWNHGSPYQRRQVARQADMERAAPTGQATSDVPEDSWSISDAIHWIAYRVEPGTGPAIFYPDPGCGRMFEPNLMAALEARAKAAPRSWPPNASPLPAPRDLHDPTAPATPAYVFRWIIKRWMRETGLAASALHGKAISDRAKYEAEKKAWAGHEQQRQEALRGLNHRVRAGKLRAMGRPKTTQETPASPTLRQQLPPELIDPPRAITASGEYGVTKDGELQFFGDCGPWFYDIIVSADEARKQWPAPPAINPTSRLRDPPTSEITAFYDRLRDRFDEDNRPTVSDQRALASEYFTQNGYKAPSEDRMRDARKSIGWSEAGRRPKASRPS